MLSYSLLVILSCRIFCFVASLFCVEGKVLELRNLVRLRPGRYFPIMSGVLVTDRRFDLNLLDGILIRSKWDAKYLVLDLERWGLYFSCVFFLMAC